MNKKGQALIEFILILPVFIFLLFVVYDFGMIFTTKNKIESSISDIIEFYKEGKTVSELRIMYSDLTISLDDDTDYTKIVVKDSIKLITPGFNRIFGNPYQIMVERYIPYEQ